MLAALMLALAPPTTADYADGLAAMENGDYPTAFAEFARAAAEGDMRAANQLGELYERGDGVDRDPGRAAEWYRRAAEAGNREAQYNYAGMLRGGDGVALDAVESMRWYQRAADQGLAIAQFFVAKNYEHGQGTSQDLAEAWAWYSLAAVGGDDGSARNRDRVAQFLDAARQARAVRLLREHAIDLELPPDQLAALGVAPGAAEARSRAAAGDTEPVVVAAIQQALVDLGYTVGVVDGVAGPLTRRALVDFARSVGMEEQPRIGNELLDRLHATIAARGAATRALAEELLPSAVPSVDTSPVQAGSADPAASSPVAMVSEPVPVSVDDATLASSPEILQRLAALGYERVDLEDRAERALAAFRRDAGVEAVSGQQRLLDEMDRLAPLAASAPSGSGLVRAVQSALAAQGHDPGPVDGVMGSRTRVALEQYARDAGLAETPQVSAVLLARLRTPAVPGPSVTLPTSADEPASEPSPDVLSPVSAASADSVDTPPPSGRQLVLAVQGRLAELGYEPGPADGVVGARTRAAAREFRDDRGLAGGTEVDVALFEQLRAVQAVSSPTGIETTPAPVVAVEQPSVTSGATSVAASAAELAAELPSPAPLPGVPVAEAQRLLSRLGFDVGTIDGIAGTRTRNAVLAFERANRFSANGRIDAALIARLGVAVAGQAEMVAIDPKLLAEMRVRLIARGYRPGDTGAATSSGMRDALLAFQRDEGLDATGIPDLPTVARLRTTPEPVTESVALVRALQTAPAERGHDAGSADGALGPRTRAAILAYRAVAGLPEQPLIDIALLRRLDIPR